MARTAITVQTVAAYGGVNDDITMTAMDATNDMQFTHPGGTVLVLIANGSGGALTADVIGVASPKTFNRASDKTLTPSAGETSVAAIPDVGFDQGAGVVHIDLTDDTSMTIAVIAMTPTP